MANSFLDDLLLWRKRQWGKKSGINLKRDLSYPYSFFFLYKSYFSNFLKTVLLLHFLFALDVDASNCNDDFMIIHSDGRCRS